MSRKAGRYITKRILFVEEKLLKSIGVKYFQNIIDHLKNAKSLVRRIPFGELMCFL
jgi:hypothetical protein